MRSPVLVSLIGCYYAARSPTFTMVEAFTPSFSTTFTRRKHSPSRIVLRATSASAAYLGSLSSIAPPEKEAFLGATSKYLDTLSNHLDIYSTVSDAQFDSSFLTQATDELANTLLDAMDSSSQTLASSLWDMDLGDSTGLVAADNPLTTATSPDEQSFQDLSTRLNRLTNRFRHSIHNKNEVPTSTNNPQYSMSDRLNEFSSQLKNSLSNIKTQKIEQTLSSAGETAEESTAMNVVSRKLEQTLSSATEVMGKATTAISDPFEQMGANLSSKTISAITAMDQTVEATGAKLSSLTSSFLAADSAVATATAASAATANSAGKISAAALAAQHGWSEDLGGVIQIIVATLLAVPRAIIEGVTDQPIDILLSDLHPALMAPLSAPLQGMETMTTLEQAQALLNVLQLLLALVVGAPFALVEGLTGLTMLEIQTNVSQWEISAVTDSFMEFAGTAVVAIVAVLKVVTAGFGTASEEVLTATSTFLTEEMLPAIIDGFVLFIQQVLMFLLDGGAALMATV